MACTASFHRIFLLTVVLALDRFHVIPPALRSFASAHDDFSSSFSSHSSHFHPLACPHPLLVSTTSGSFLGFTSRLPPSAPSLDIWRGIPYAEPPSGTLRFRAPVPLDLLPAQAAQVQPAYEFGDACPQQPVYYVQVPISENCLSLNVYRPSGAQSTSNHLLPVLVWIHGGSLTTGSSSTTDASILVRSSIEMAKPIVFVSVNYRLNSFGFLNSDDLPLEDLQAGLLDQVASLKWLKSNIARFGGDPQRITAWGQSAGALSIALLMTYLPKPRTSSEALFRAAIMDSGSPTSHTVPRVALYDEEDQPYNLLLKITGCHRAGGSQEPPSLECLRSLPYESLLNATQTISQTKPFNLQLTIWGPSYKPGSLVDRRPSAKLSDGDFIRIPVLMGTNKDEGTLASASAVHASEPSDLSDNQLFFSLMSNTSVLDLAAVDPTVYARVAELYPDEPSIGSPFDTGNQTFGFRPLFKRLAAWYGDLHYQAPRRLWAKKTSTKQPTFVYYFDGPRNSSDPLYAGVPHTSELNLIFGNGWNKGLSQSEIAANERLASRMREYYINFVSDMNPGDDWPVYTHKEPKVMRFNKQIDQVEIIKDDWRKAQMQYLNSQPAINTYLT